MLEEIKISQKGNNHESVIVVEPLPQGYGMTLGNALRRVLLSSLPGSAITQVKIPGAPHEYSTIKGVKEDVVEILLNLEATGPKEAKAADIKTPPNVKVSNPDLIIAHLADSKTKLNIDLTAEKGVGYAPVENRKSLGIGVIPLGATFSPVLKVNYRIESTRVGQMTNFDKLTLEIITDGTITPAETIKEAAKILADYFNVLVEQKQPRKEKKEVVRKPKVEKDASIEELELSTRITNALRSAGIETVGQLLSSPKDQLSKLKNMGAKSISDIEEKIKEKGLV